MTKSLAKFRDVPKKISAALVLFALVLLAGSVTSDQAAAHSPRYVKRTVYECVTGWWSVRTGSRYTYPSDGKFRPSWHQRCRKVTVYVEE